MTGEGALPVAPVEAQEAPSGREDRDWRAYGQEMHRRAQVAEGALAAKPEYATLTDALNELRRAKSKRHALRNEVSFMKNERSRLKREIADLRAANAALAQSGVDEPRPGADMASARAAMWERLCDHFSEMLVERWHESDFPLKVPRLAEWMGLTESQYAAWVAGRWDEVLARPGADMEARHSPRGGGTT